MMCKVFEVTESSYYRWLKQGISNRWKRDEQLLIEIMVEQSNQSYGAPLMTEELNARGWSVGKN